MTIHVRGRGLFEDSLQKIWALPDWSKERALEMTVAAGAKPGRYIIELRTSDESGVEGCDAYFAVDVVSP